MARLPTVGGDSGNWGTVLNEYLETAHNADGTLKLDVQTIAALKAVDVTTVSDKQQVLVAGYYASGDQGGGAFYYDAGSSDTDNGGTVIAPTAGAGRWKRTYSGAVNVKWFGAKGDGVTDDTAAWKNSIAVAMRYSAVLYIGPGTYSVTAAAGLSDASSVAVDSCDSLVIYGSGTIQLKSGTIASTSHTPILDLRGPGYLEISGITFDQNRGGQDYPGSPSSTKLGTGSNGFRDNAAVRVTARSSSAASGRVIIKNCKFTNGYIAGLALVEVSSVAVENCDFTDCTWNGITFCSVRHLVISGCTFTRCGTYTGVYTPADFIRSSDSLPTGDRAGIQGRCRPNDWTESGQGYPVLSTLYPNGVVRVSKCKFVSCAVEGVYVRSSESAVIEDNYVENVGLDVPSDYVFNPAGIWLEWCMYGLVKNNNVIMTAAPADKVPDGIRPTAMEGTGSSTGSFADDPVPFEGTGFVECCDNIISVNRGFPATTEGQWWRYGIYPNSNQRISGGKISHCSASGIYAINRGAWIGDRLNNFSVDGVVFEYCKTAITVTQYSGGVAPTGTLSLRATNITAKRMYDADSGGDDRCIFTVPSSFNSIDVDISIDGFKGDLTNASGGSAYRAGLFRGSNASRFVFRNHEIINFDQGYTVYNFKSARFINIRAEAGAELISHLANIGQQNSGSLIIDGLDTLDLTASPIKLTPSTYTLDRLVLNSVRTASSTNVGIISGLDPTHHLIVTAGSDVTAYGSHSLPATLPRSLAADVGDANSTITMASPRTQRLSTPLTADRTVTLPTTGMKNGDQWLFVRSSASTGSSVWNIGSSASLASGQACLLIRDTSAWVAYKWSLA